MTAPGSLRADGAVALDGFTLRLDLDASPGEVVGLVGPNGAGKTATLRALLGITPLTEGRVTLGDRVLDDGRSGVPLHARGLGWVPQTPALLPRRRVRDQVATFATATPLLGSPDDILRRLDLDPADRRRPDRLSGGQAQRVAVARALATSPVVLVDEPTSAQDGGNANRVREALAAHAAAGGTVVTVAHRPEDAYALADRLVVLEDGEVRQTGTPVELAAAPATPYVARVVGATVLEGEVGDDHVLRGPWGELTVADGCPTGPVLAVIRPSTVVLHNEPPVQTSSRNLLTGTVRSIHETTEGTTVMIESAPPLIAAVTLAAVATLRLAIGQRVHATVKATEVEVHRR